MLLPNEDIALLLLDLCSSLAVLDACAKIQEMPRLLDLVVGYKIRARSLYGTGPCSGRTQDNNEAIGSKRLFQQ